MPLISTCLLEQAEKKSEESLHVQAIFFYPKGVCQLNRHGPKPRYTQIIACWLTGSQHNWQFQISWSSAAEMVAGGGRGGGRVSGQQGGPKGRLVGEGRGGDNQSDEDSENVEREGTATTRGLPSHRSADPPATRVHVLFLVPPHFPHVDQPFSRAVNELVSEWKRPTWPRHFSRCQKSGKNNLIATTKLRL